MKTTILRRTGVSSPTFAATHHGSVRTRFSFFAVFILTCLSIHGQNLIRNYTPAGWKGTNVSWIRDLEPRNKIDDFIDGSAETVFDIVVNYNRCVTESDLEKLNSLSQASQVQMSLPYLSSVAVGRVSKAEVATIAADTGVAFIERQFGFTPMLNTSLASICVTAGPCSTNTVAEAFPSINGTGTVIAILDSGIANGHPTFANTSIVGSYDAVTQSNVDPPDDLFHGTLVASIALGKGTTNTPRGIATQAGLVDVRIFNAATAACSGAGGWVAAVAGLQKIYDEQATWNVDVINMSFAQCGPNGLIPSDGLDAFSQLVDLAPNWGILVVAAASNYGPNNTGLPAPAAASSALAVAAVNDQNTVARGDDAIFDLSAAGPRDADGDQDQLDELKPEIAAPGAHGAVCTGFNPGNGILGARNSATDLTQRFCGTSVAAAHVSGVAALMFQARPTATPGSIKQGIISTATAMGSASFPAIDPGWNSRWGYGMLHAFSAVDAINKANNPAPVPPVVAVPASVPGRVPAVLNSLPAPADVGFPSHPANPGWLSPDITTSPFPPQIGQKTMITARIRNLGPNNATRVRINFGVDVYSATTPAFYHIGSKIVDVPANPTGTDVTIEWTPQTADHQCLKAAIDYGSDPNPDDNNAQRNINVQRSPATFFVRNTYSEGPVTIKLAGSLAGLAPEAGFVINPSQLTLSPEDCPQPVTAEIFLPPGAMGGTAEQLHVEAFVETFFGPITLGGVTVLGETTDPPPALVGKGAGGAMELSWQDERAILQETPFLTPEERAWTIADLSVIKSGNLLTATVPPTSASRFFRLVRPVPAPILALGAAARVQVSSPDLINGVLDFGSLPAVPQWLSDHHKQHNRSHRRFVSIRNQTSTSITLTAFEFRDLQTSDASNPFSVSAPTGISLDPGMETTMALAFFPATEAVSTVRLVALDAFEQPLFVLPLRGAGRSLFVGEFPPFGAFLPAVMPPAGSRAVTVREGKFIIAGRTVDPSLTAPSNDCVCDIIGGGEIPNPAIQPNLGTIMNAENLGLDEGIANDPVNVGQHIVLSSAIVCDGEAVVQSVRWVVGGPAIKNYTDSLRAGTVTEIPLQEPDLRKRDIDFYWKDDGTYTVTLNLTFTHRGATKTCTVNRNFTVEQNMNDQDRQMEDFFVWNHQGVVLLQHEGWHLSFGAAPCVSAAGADFFVFHRQVLGTANAWRRTFGGYPAIVPWDGTMPVPATPDANHRGRFPRLAGFTLPSYYQRNPARLVRAPCPARRVVKLKDFASATELAVEMEGSYHGEGHVRVGGEMASPSTSPKDPVFYRWHKHIDNIYENFLRP